MPDKRGSNRYGWNARGGTVAQQLENARYQTELLDPDSYHWKNKANNWRFALIELMGEAAFLEWADRLFPGDSIENATWQEIAELYEAKLHVIQGDDRHWSDDPKHYKMNGYY
jgi:hypothetical protein